MYVCMYVGVYTTDWTTGRSRFDPGRDKMIFPLASVLRPAEAHPASCTKGTGGPFPGG
jgi:hypothetical protein